MRRHPKPIVTFPFIGITPRAAEPVTPKPRGVIRQVLKKEPDRWAHVDGKALMAYLERLIGPMPARHHSDHGPVELITRRAILFRTSLSLYASHRRCVAIYFAARHLDH